MGNKSADGLVLSAPFCNLSFKAPALCSAFKFLFEELG